MILAVIQDQGINAFGNPYVFRNDADAVRTFVNEIRKDDGSILSVNHSDFVLVCVGSYDDATGVVTGESAVVLCHGKDVSKS